MPTETTTPDNQHEETVGANHLVTPAPETTTADDDIDYDAADFAAALESFDREQAEEKAAASSADAARMRITAFDQSSHPPASMIRPSRLSRAIRSRWTGRCAGRRSGAWLV